jgi:4-amino-4-deoxy-L-arabinose transferase-like glycosyltransferase
VNSTVATGSEPATDNPMTRLAREYGLDAAAVAVGSVLMVIAALNQPYNQNEIQQIAPYDTTDLHKITTATRQPPLDPLLGALVQHIVGQGQLRQRLVPVIAGIGILVLMACLLRHLRAGLAGTAAVWVLATAPLMVRYSAYARPYSLPLFFMMLFAYGAQRWLDGGGRRWLVVTAAAAIAMPLTRVPEPTLFLVVTGVVMVVLPLRRRLTWAQAGPVLAVCLAAVVFVCYPEYHSLASKAASIWDPSPHGIITRFGSGVHEVLTGLLPLAAKWQPWWPVTVIVVAAAFVIPDSRRRVSQMWFFWPLLAGPLVFAVAYHFMNPFPFSVRPYRARMAIFFVPSYALLVAALAGAALDAAALGRRLRIAVGVVVAAVLLGQLPATARVLVDNESPDFGQAAQVVTQDLPSDAVVLYDTVSPAGQWRQPFSARPRYMGSTPYVGTVSKLGQFPNTVPKRGPVYVLLLDSQCAFSVVCDEPRAVWKHPLRGWKVAKRFDRFTLYQPDRSLDGRHGVVTALEQFGRAMGPNLGYVEIFDAASILKSQGRAAKAHALITQMYDTAPAEVAQRIRSTAHKHDLDPFG